MKSTILFLALFALIGLTGCPTELETQNLHPSSSNSEGSSTGEITYSSSSERTSKPFSSSSIDDTLTFQQMSWVSVYDTNSAKITLSWTQGENTLADLQEIFKEVKVYAKIWSESRGIKYQQAVRSFNEFLSDGPQLILFEHPAIAEPRNANDFPNYSTENYYARLITHIEALLIQENDSIMTFAPTDFGSFSLQVDPIYGAIYSLFIDFSQRAVDDELGMSLKDLQFLQAPSAIQEIILYTHTECQLQEPQEVHFTVEQAPWIQTIDLNKLETLAQKNVSTCPPNAQCMITQECRQFVDLGIQTKEKEYLYTTNARLINYDSEYLAYLKAILEKIQ